MKFQMCMHTVCLGQYARTAILCAMYSFAMFRVPSSRPQQGEVNCLQTSMHYTWC